MDIQIGFHVDKSKGKKKAAAINRKDGEWREEKVGVLPEMGVKC